MWVEDGHDAGVPTSISGAGDIVQKVVWLQIGRLEIGDQGGGGMESAESSSGSRAFFFRRGLRTRMGAGVNIDATTRPCRPTSGSRSD